jgi:hypothetical protein
MRLHEVKEVCNAMKRLNAGELGPDDLVKLRKRGAEPETWKRGRSVSICLKGDVISKKSMSILSSSSIWSFAVACRRHLLGPFQSAALPACYFRFPDAHASPIVLAHICNSVILAGHSFGGSTAVSVATV